MNKNRYGRPNLPLKHFAFLQFVGTSTRRRWVPALSHRNWDRGGLSGTPHGDHPLPELADAGGKVWRGTGLGAVWGHQVLAMVPAP